MKHFCIHAFLAALMLLSLSLTASNDAYKIIIEPMWCDLDDNTTSHHAHFGTQWILVGSITFEKKSKEPVTLHRIHLQWHGEHLEQLTASLYRKIPDKDFYPVEATLICDGVWSEKKQTLMLTFNEEKNLGFRTIFYLVLTIPDHLVPLIKQGSFSLLSHTLPEHFRPISKSTTLCLSLNTIDTSIASLTKK